MNQNRSIPFSPIVEADTACLLHHKLRLALFLNFTASAISLHLRILGRRILFPIKGEQGSAGVQRTGTRYNDGVTGRFGVKSLPAFITIVLS
jgi:hypothetical protein